jgi:hypothetical protein
VFQSKIGLLSLLLQTSGARHEPAMIIELIAEFDIFSLAIVMSVLLLFMDSDYPFGIFTHFSNMSNSAISSIIMAGSCRAPAAPTLMKAMINI